MNSAFRRWRIRSGLILAIDAALAFGFYYLAFFLRFEGRIPPAYVEVFRQSVLLLVLLRLGFSLAFGLHRWSFRMSGFHEAVRLSLAAISASAAFVTYVYFLQRLGPPRSVIVLEFFLTTTAMAAFRFSPRFASSWYLDQRRSRRPGRAATVIVGAGSAGDLLLRDLVRSDQHPYHVVGFVDDDRRKIGTLLGGKPVFGEIERLPEFVARHGVTQILIAIPRLSPERIRTILQLCSRLKIQFKTIPVSFSYLNDRITASMLQALSPEDLLRRDAASFDPGEIRRLVSGKSVLVTGAAGSIGSEIARQTAACELESLVLVDLNENNLYFLARELQDRHPGLPVFAEVADIREQSRLTRLGRLHRPHFVFHAAAHKHVPLMEDAPEEAVKNNVFGTANAVRMASECGAERFVLISTDKAVRPSSVMGATKRVAEHVARDLARGSKTRVTAVRFGNVLGSAGSVVPLFKEQIARGGPVTVTHPDCRRYFMTCSEAVGLVILAGLGDYGELCVLDMGEPIRILDLAHHMITMSGLVPDVDIRVEFTGLRPGEKLTEELMTDEEEKTQVVRNGVFVVKSPAAPRSLWEGLDRLRLVSESGDRALVLEALRDLVPTYTGLPPLAAPFGPPSLVDTPDTARPH
ncbi:MAG: polysaccharide biosynthesis protein [Thermoanaerobaculia bacterium]